MTLENKLQLIQQDFREFSNVKGSNVVVSDEVEGYMQNIDKSPLYRDRRDFIAQYKQYLLKGGN